jgi:hypothetical protein
MPDHSVVPGRVRLLAFVMAIALAAVSYAIWTSPLARRTAGQILANPVPGHGLARQSMPQQDSPEQAARPEPVSRAKRASANPAEADLRAQVAALRARLGNSGSTRPAGSGGHDTSAPARKPAPSTEDKQPARGPTGPSAPAPHPKKCWDFTWQQDAQAAYIADLSDPLGLDGAPGPYDDDGIACAELPVDPSRPPSVPIGAKPVRQPTAPALDSLRLPAQHYFGMYTEQSPYNWAELDKVAKAVGKIPNMAGYFGAGDEAFRTDAVLASWERGMLPFLTWELRPKADMGPGGAENLRPGWGLADIATGSIDPYLKAYAHAVAAVGLPIAIRLDHEMNGAWYPWSVYTQVNGRDGRTGAEWYQLMWRHVHDVFVQSGATNVLWVWSPNIITWARSDFRNFYPGDDYVDWIGLSGYYRRTAEAPTFDTTYGPTLRKLRNLALFPHASKPILLSEIGATENGGSKAIWIRSLFAAFKSPENADILGFAWFHNVVTGSPGAPDATTNDWRITSSKLASSTFADGISDPSFGAGRK